MVNACSLILFPGRNTKGCWDVFKKYPFAKCIVYDDGECDDGDWSIALSSGQTETFTKESKYYEEIESISVQDGCQLRVWKGNLPYTS